MKEILLIHPNDSATSLPDPLNATEDGLVAVGGNLSVERLLEAYSKGIFPWFNEQPVLWFSPDPRLVLYPRSIHISRSLKRIIQKKDHNVKFDTDFDRIIDYCSKVPRRDQKGTWINTDMIDAYKKLFTRHIVHCVGIYNKSDDLIGGLYGVVIGKCFFGESMFSLESNASKLALYYLCQKLMNDGFGLIDCQVSSDYLKSMGAVEISREIFLKQLKESISGSTDHCKWC